MLGDELIHRKKQMFTVPVMNGLKHHSKDIVKKFYLMEDLILEVL